MTNRNTLLVEGAVTAHELGTITMIAGALNIPPEMSFVLSNADSVYNQHTCEGKGYRIEISTNPRFPGEFRVKAVRPRGEQGLVEDIRISGMASPDELKLSHINPSFVFLKKPVKGSTPFIVIDIKQPLEEGLELRDFPEDLSVMLPYELQGMNNGDACERLFALMRHTCGLGL